MDKYIEQRYPIKCRGRDKNGKEALTEYVNVDVIIYKRPEGNTLSSDVKCNYNVGGHGQRCKASHPDVGKLEDGIICPYAFDIPFALEK